MKRKVYRSTLINFKVTPNERKAIVSNARKYAQGSISAWLRSRGQMLDNTNNLERKAK